MEYDVLTDSNMAGIFSSITEVSEANEYKIDISFDRRMRVWKTQILTGRMNSIRQEQSIEYIHRMMDLLIADADRLTNSAIRIYDEYEVLGIIEDIDTTTKDEISKYLTEVNTIKLKVISEGE